MALEKLLGITRKSICILVAAGLVSCTAIAAPGRRAIRQGWHC